MMKSNENRANQIQQIIDQFKATRHKPAALNRELTDKLHLYAALSGLDAERVLNRLMDSQLSQLLDSRDPLGPDIVSMFRDEAFAQLADALDADTMRDEAFEQVADVLDKTPDSESWKARRNAVARALPGLLSP